MNKAINAILGIGVAIVLFLFFILSFKVIFVEPEWEDCWTDNKYSERPLDPYNITEEQKLEQEEMKLQNRECSERNQAKRDEYSQKVFFSSIIIGMLLILSIIPLLKFANIAAGTGASGIALFVYGLIVGWTTTTDLTKLFLLFIAVVIVVGLALWLNIKKK
jgi:hypothetical protein